MALIPDGNNHRLVMKINDVEVMSQNIISFTLREWIFTQTIELDCVIMDSGTFTEHFPIYEDSKVYAEIYTENNKPIILNLSLSDFEIERTNSGTLINMIHFTALPDINDYFMTFRSRNFKHKLSSSVIKDVMDNLNAKTDIRITTNDIQDWYQLSVDDYTFVKQTIKRSFLEIEDSPFCYMELDNTLVLTSLKTECRKNSKAKFIENGFLSHPDKKISDMAPVNKTKVVYFGTSSFRKNVSSSMNKSGAYGAFVTYYDNSAFHNHILNFKYAPFTKFTNTNNKHIGDFGRSDNFSTQNSSVHKNYYVSMVQNDYIRTMFFSDYTQITIPADPTIRLFDRITVNFQDCSTKQESLTPSIDKVNSGDYIIGGITHSITKDGMYSMILVIFRNGINEPDKSPYNINLVKI